MENRQYSVQKQGSAVNRGSATTAIGAEAKKVLRNT